MSKTEELEERIKKLEQQVEELAREIARLNIHNHEPFEWGGRIIKAVGKPLDDKTHIPIVEG